MDKKGGGREREREEIIVPSESSGSDAEEEMSAEGANGSPGSEVSGGLGLEETELKLAPPGSGKRGVAAAGGGGWAAADADRKRAFPHAVGLTLNRADRAAEPTQSKAASSVNPPAAKAQVVGWPPVRSFRKNALKSCTYVKVAVDGAPYLRKVDLAQYGGYQQLLAALEDMFSCFAIRNCPEERGMVDTVSGTEYVPTYEDKDGDWMLVGDVPWKMFVESCKRLRLMKSSEAVNLAPRTPQRSTTAG